MELPLNPSERYRPRGISRRKFLGHAAGAAALTVVSSRKIAAALGQAAGQEAGTGASRAALLRVGASKPVNSFDPDKSLGSSMDELSVPVIEKIYTPEMVRQWLSAGWGPITYRNHTELAVEAWHWNSNGRWSDPAHQRGYFVGDAEPTGFIHDLDTRCRIAARRRTAAIPRVTGGLRTAIRPRFGRAIHTSPRRLLAKTTCCIRNGSSWICSLRSRSMPCVSIGASRAHACMKCNIGPALTP
jgi:hypothetical protein